MAELLDEVGQIESTTVLVHRTAATVKGGRRFSFGALVVVGDRRGRVGYAYTKSNAVASAVEKAQRHARRNMVTVPMVGYTIPHEVEGTCRATTVRLIPASPGTGVVAGSSVRAVLELAGVTDCLTKCYGSTNAINAVKAVFNGLAQLRTREQVARLRGIDPGPTAIEAKLERGQAAGAPATASGGHEPPEARSPARRASARRRGAESASPPADAFVGSQDHEDSSGRS